MLGRMVNHMGSPKQTAFMRNAMEPIIGEVISEKNEYKAPPSDRNREKSKMFVDIKKRSQHNGFTQKTQKHITYTHTYGSKGILGFIGFYIFPNGYDQFYQHRQNKKWNGVQNDIWKLGHSTLFIALNYKNICLFLGST
jgi:hypothetical protein